jgi:phosphohistidine phosphatase SixA
MKPQVSASRAAAAGAGTLLFLLALVGGAARAQPPAEGQPESVVYLLRHAEKVDDSDESGLTERGEARARALADLLASEPVVAVIASQFRRTQLTVLPLASRLGESVGQLEVIDAHDYDAVVSRLRELRPGQAAVVCGHSNTVPVIAELLGVASPPSEAEVVYGDLYVVRLVGDRATFERRRYGDP